jgi:predicted Abi (CAAX) family protease
VDRVRSRVLLAGCVVERKTLKALPRLGATLLGGTVAMPALGLLTGFLCWTPKVPDLLELLALLVMPGVTEELWFRCVLLPLPEERGRPGQQLPGGASWSSDELESNQQREETPAPPRSRGWSRFEVLSFVTFLVYHLDFVHRELHLPVFRDPRFLLLAGVIGVTCTQTVLESGSLWPGVLYHGVSVWVWKTLLSCGRI